MTLFSGQQITLVVECKVIISRVLYDFASSAYASVVITIDSVYFVAVIRHAIYVSWNTRFGGDTGVVDYCYIDSVFRYRVGIYVDYRE